MNHVLDSTKAYELIIDNEADMAGLRILQRSDSS